MKKKKAKAAAKKAPKAKAKPTKGKKKVKAKPEIHLKSKRRKIGKSTVIVSIARKVETPRPQKMVEEKPLSASETQKFRTILSEKEEELSAIVHRKKEEQEFQQEDPEIGDEADIATRSVEKELLFDITDSEKQALDGIEAALRKIDKGVYGRCESCQKTIPRLRLEVMPWARYCISCQARNEVPSAAPEA